MNDETRIEQGLNEHYRMMRSQVHTAQDFDRKVLSQARTAQQRAIPERADRTWRGLLMRYGLAGMTLAAVAIALIVALCLTETTVSTAYAVGQTLEAIKAVRTVHMRGEFVKQGTFECWMRFAGDVDHPTHVWLGLPGRPNCKICGPNGVFGLNLRTHRVHFASRDERDKNWFPPFGSFLKQTLEEARRNAWITVTLPTDANTSGDSSWWTFVHPSGTSGSG